jgi:aspartyl aminopeptidase
MDKMDKVEQLEQNCWTILSPGEKEAVHKFSGGYIKFLNESKTEREAVDYIYGLALEEKIELLKQRQKEYYKHPEEMEKEP